MARKKVSRTRSTADRSLEEMNQRQDYKTVIDENTDDLKRSEETFSEDQMPDLDFSEIMFVHPMAAENMIEAADTMIERMMAHVGPDKQKPSVPGLKEMYDKTFEIKDKNAGSVRTRKDDNFIPTVKEIEVHAPATLDDLLKAKFTFEKNSHKNKADSMLASINVGAAIATIKVNWDFAVQTYKETRENAEANFREAVYSAYINEEFQMDSRVPNFFNDILTRMASFTFAVGVSKAMDGQPCVAR